MGLRRLVAPTVEPLTVAEVAAHLRLDESRKEPVPAAPTVARVSPAAAGDLSDGVYRYRVTFVTADGETDGGQISAAVTITDHTVNGRVLVSEIPLGGALVTARRLYRTTANGATYFLLATLANNTATTYTDNIADAALGVGVPTVNTTGDAELRALIQTAREHVEAHTRRALLTQTWALTLMEFPWGDAIALPIAPLQSVSSVQYVSGAGTTETMSPSDYAADLGNLPPLVIRGYGVTWPVTRTQRNAVTVEFVAGYGSAAADVPAAIRAAMKLLIGHWYANREAVNVGNITTELPLAVAALLAPYRIPEVA